ncbi:hypothetical protein D5W64_12775 [Salmonella enterica subsp. enterica serovar Saintpaul]|nr:hypothetical protein [Salmonella enterica subsp. enterica serovar Saintpaul]
MVSSHDNVRAALHEENIPFTLVYPERELKGEYLERYEGRGSPEAFINMMEHKWNDFIDSAISDVSENRIVLGEGKYLLDAVKEKIQEVVFTADVENGEITGFESTEELNAYYERKKALMDQEEINVAILDTNANVDEASGIIPQPDTLEPSVMNEAENGVNVDEVAGAQPAVDASTVDDSAMDHSDYVEAYYETSGDIEVIESVIQASGNPEIANIECIQDNSETMVNATAYLKEKYGADVEPTISGLESFLGKLKSVHEASKGKLNKSNTVSLAGIFKPVIGAESTEEVIVEPVVEETVSTLPPRDYPEMLEDYYEMKDDVEVIETILEQAGSPEFAGNEHYQDNSETLVKMSEIIKDKYGREIEPTIQGMEGFFADLKEAFSETIKELTGNSIADKAKIKRYFHEARGAIAQYTSKAWLDKQKWINVGKVSLQVPAALKEVNTGDGINAIITPFSKACEKQVKDNLANAEARLTAGLKVYNQLKNKEPVKGEALAKLVGEIKPDALPDVTVRDIESLINLSLSKGEMPVLKKNDIPGVIKVLKDALDSVDRMYTGINKLLDRSLSVDDFLEPDFFEATFKEKPIRELYDATTFDANGWNVEYIAEGYCRQMLVIAKFIETWILKSVK